jgi:hypothetical protein
LVPGATVTSFGANANFVMSTVTARGSAAAAAIANVAAVIAAATADVNVVGRK